MRFLRRNKFETVETFPISLTGKDGESWIEYPAEVVGAVRQSVNRIMRTHPFPDRLVLTSAVRQEGVSYLSKAFGAVLAADFEQTCCVVELNWWWPADDPKALNGKPGVAEVLEEKMNLKEVLVPTGDKNLSLLPPGNLASKLRPSFAGSEGLKELIDSVSSQFDHVVLDVPAVTATSDSILLAGLGNILCLVVNQGVTPVQKVKSALDDLNHLDLAGVIMNQVDIAMPSLILDYIAQE